MKENLDILSTQTQYMFLPDCGGAKKKKNTYQIIKITN